VGWGVFPHQIGRVSPFRSKPPPTLFLRLIWFPHSFSFSLCLRRSDCADVPPSFREHPRIISSTIDRQESSSLLFLPFCRPNHLPDSPLFSSFFHGESFECPFSPSNFLGLASFFFSFLRQKEVRSSLPLSRQFPSFLPPDHIQFRLFFFFLIFGFGM